MRRGATAARANGRGPGRLEEAAACFRRAAELRPDFPEIHNNLGTMLRELGRFAESEVCYRRALELRSDHPEFHFNLGNVLRETGRCMEAEGCYRRALACRPNWADAHYNLGIAPDQPRPARGSRPILSACPGSSAPQDRGSP